MSSKCPFLGLFSGATTEVNPKWQSLPLENQWHVPIMTNSILYYSLHYLAESTQNHKQAHRETLNGIQEKCNHSQLQPSTQQANQTKMMTTEQAKVILVSRKQKIHFATSIMGLLGPDSWESANQSRYHHSQHQRSWDLASALAQGEWEWGQVAYKKTPSQAVVRKIGSTFESHKHFKPNPFLLI